MTTKLKWRLGKLPTPLEVQGLVNDKIITKEEAREILFNQETEEDSAKLDSLKSEIKFLRELVEKLTAHSSSRIIEVIKEVYRPYEHWPWYRPYYTWCSNAGSQDLSAGTGTVTYAATNLVAGTSGGSNTITLADNSFTKIKTF